jgi:glycine cleavage system transcriptional repressor
MVGQTSRVRELAVTVVGADRPGIVADVSAALAALQLNLTDTSMTRLRSHFAMTLVCAGEVSPERVREALEPLSGERLTVTVAPVEEETREVPAGRPYVLSVHGADRLGIVAQLTGVLAAARANITDLTTRLAGDLYLLVAEVDVPSGVDVDDLGRRLAEAAERVGVDATWRPADVDLL